MKADIHPDYREVVFQDTNSGTMFVTRSTIETQETVEFEGSEYPLAKVEISAASHPFFTGTMTIVDTAGRVERFERRYGRRKTKGAAPEAPAAEAPEEEAPATEAPAEEAAEAPAPEAPAAEAPAEEAPATEAPAEEAASEAPAEDAAADASSEEE